MNKEIYVRLIPCKTKDGRDFNAYETTDTKDKKRLSVAFLRGECNPPENSCKIAVISARMDFSKRFPVLRVADYDIVEEDKQKKNEKAVDQYI